ncbi:MULTISPECIES: DUF3299 domain-containing protein [Ruegeria]|uniref:DUF3299 domain-containing protein n=1 Tax=Ruegeria atlantica TaxID=81569 RepID=A0ABX1WH98_9RHOB|nr:MULTISPECIES: DUF3299 domain-containing protein [Ruegeria]NOC85378.1 DUF3299 domain-containing protein [Ruegeria sp. HKCCD6428]NOD32668.1 DUF3299 domain-containing protein [Ruegeria atlantica]NOD62734.1 DUF3299 domain-containing protein [Ruegeria sp. HKCCD6109]NOD69625.1 DUF3299 domain-containing protein [Ruegeria sp. HKCCD7303]NOD99077.1 DUF3299 domain-containing protein [Ruegeria sp. HKCCD6228]
MKIWRIVCVASLISTSLSAEIAELDWNQLIDEESQEYVDPFKELTPDQLSGLVEVVRLKLRLDSGAHSEDVRKSLEAKILENETPLQKAGIDVDWLIEQRWVVAERRKKAATAGNPEIDGKVVKLAGYAIPAPPDPDGTNVAYLVPERGMCSHTPPPNPNQLIRVRLPEGWYPERFHEPVRLTGIVSISPSERTMNFVDGFVPMRATYSFEAQYVEAGDDLPAYGWKFTDADEVNDPSAIGKLGSGAAKFDASKLASFRAKAAREANSN